MAGTEAVAAPVDNSPSLVSAIGEMFGDYRDAEPESDAGAPPVETPEPAASSEGDAAPPEADGQSVPDASPPIDSDPLEGAAPLDYVVDGQPRNYEGITVLKDGGAIIDPDALADVRTRLSERDHLYEQSQVQRKELAAIHQATEWKQGDTVLRGVEALEAQRVYTAQASVALGMVLDVLKPENFAKYATIAQTGRVYEDGSPELAIVPNEQAMAMLKEQLAFKTDRAAFTAQRNFAPIRSQIPQAPKPVPDAPIESMDLVPTVNAFAKSLGVTVTPDSAAFLAKAMPRYVRATTAEERPVHGPRIVDWSFNELVKREATQASTTAKIADTATAAAKANQAKLAAASVGTKGQKNAPRIAAKPDAEPTRADDFDTNFDRLQSAAAGAMRAHR